MFLQSLIDLYDIVKSSAPDTIPDMGFSEEKIEANICIDINGKIVGIEDVRQKKIEEKKTKKGTTTKETLIPITKFMPTHTKRSSSNGGYGYYLCDNVSHVLGIATDKQKPEVTKNNLQSFIDNNKELIKKINDENLDNACLAFLNFLNNYDNEKFKKSELFEEKKDFLLKDIKFNIMFTYVSDTERFEILENTNLINTYKQAYSDKINEFKSGYDFTDNSSKPLAYIHDMIRLGASPNPLILKSDSMPTAQFSENGYQMSIVNMEKYTKALNYLILNQMYTRINDDTYIICYAKTKSKQINELFPSIFSPYDYQANTRDNEFAKFYIDKIKKIKQTDMNSIDFDINTSTVYTVIIKADGYRFSVRYFNASPLIKILNNINKFYEDIKIEKENPNQPNDISISQMIASSKSDTQENNSNKNRTSSEFFKTYVSILNNYDLPLTIYIGAISNFNTKQFGNYASASTIKYFLINKFKMEGEKLMSINLECDNTAYLLGRLFAVAEYVQYKTQKIEGVKRLFSSASTNPAIVFPMIITQLNRNLQRFKSSSVKEEYTNLVCDIFSKLNTNNFPKALSIEERGQFDIGYYHQKNNLNKKNNENKENNEDE